MPAASVNRETCRDALASKLNTALVPTIAAAVYGYQVGDPAGLWPFVVVVSDGSKRGQWTSGAAKSRNFFKLTIMGFVPAAESASGWTEAEVDDKLDLIDKTLSDVLADNRGKKNDATLPWDYIELADDFSTIRPATVATQKCWLEIWSVIVEVRDA